MLLRADNTVATGPGASYQTPQSYFARRSGLGFVPYDPSNPYNVTGSVDYNTDTSIVDTTTQAVTALNSEAVFLANLTRQLQGQPPLDPRTVNPGVNFGLNADTQKFVTYAGLGLLAFVMLAKPRRASRRSLRRRRFYR